ncbi:MAG: hypothetical protein HXS43_04770, partial [Theionarchaea archaeon]|nr:hypothetical protein [Theionarchaea archaeon]
MNPGFFGSSNQNPLRDGIISYRRTPIEIESPENIGYDRIRFNLTESSVPDMEFTDLGLQIDRALSYTDHRGAPLLRQYIAEPHFDPRCVL